MLGHQRKVMSVFCDGWYVQHVLIGQCVSSPFNGRDHRGIIYENVQRSASNPGNLCGGGLERRSVCVPLRRPLNAYMK